MSLAVRSTVSSPSFRITPREVLTASRSLARRASTLSTMHLAAVVLVVLVGGILASIVTTTDPLWWQLHFSQLGTFHDVSGAFFNTTLKVGGALVVVYAFRVRRDLRRLGSRAGRRGAATVALICLSVIGVNLALVGCVPLNTNKDLHDKVAGMMVLGFAALLITTPVLLHRLHRRLAISTALVFVFLFAGAWLFVTATINLALFEVIAFAAMFGWSGVFTHALAQAGAVPPTTGADVAARRSASAGAPVVAVGRTLTLRWSRSPRPAARFHVVAPHPTASRDLATCQPSTGRLASVRTGRTDSAGHRSLSPSKGPDTRTATSTRSVIAAHPTGRAVGALSAGRAARVGSAGVHPLQRPPVRRPHASRAPHAGRGVAPALPRRGCTAWAAPAASRTSTTPARRSPRRPTAAR
jgi:hypothetical membrane protein